MCDVENCLECSGNNICETCESGFDLTSSQTSCVVCTEVSGCDQCSSDNVCS